MNRVTLINRLLWWAVVNPLCPKGTQAKDLEMYGIFTDYMSRCLSLFFFLFWLPKTAFNITWCVISLYRSSNCMPVTEETLTYQPCGHNKVYHSDPPEFSNDTDVEKRMLNWKLCPRWNTTHLSQACTVRTLRLHINQVLVEILELFHGGPEGHNLAGGVCRGEHLCSRHPAASPDIACGKKTSPYIL